MADSPAAATHALTMKGAQISWAILAGHKIIENRHMRMRPGWYLLHTGKGSQDAAHQEKMRGIVGAALPAEADLPHGVVVGALHVVRSLRPEECQGSVWASGPFCNVVGASCTLATPVAAQGSLGLWKPEPAVLEHVRAQLIDAPVLRNDVAHLLFPCRFARASRFWSPVTISLLENMEKCSGERLTTLLRDNVDVMPVSSSAWVAWGPGSVST